MEMSISCQQEERGNYCILIPCKDPGLEVTGFQEKDHNKIKETINQYGQLPSSQKFKTVDK